MGRHGAAYLAAEAFSKGGLYVLFVWLATSLAVDHFGLLNVFVSLLTLCGALVGLGVPEGLLRSYFRGANFSATLLLGLAIPIVMGLISLLVLAPWSTAAAAALRLPRELLLVAVAGAPLVALRQVWLAVLRARRNSRHYLMLRVLEPLLFLLLLLVFLYLPDVLSYRGAIYAYVGSIAVAALAGATLVIYQVGLAWSTEPLRRLIVFSLPLLPHGLAMTGLALFDQIVLQQLAGPEITGTYAYAYRFGMAMYLLVFAISVSWGPLAIERLQQGRAEVLRPLAVTAFRLLLAAAVLLAWCMPGLASWIGGARYAPAMWLIPLVVYAYLWVGLYSLMVAYIYSRNRTGRLAAASGAAFLVNGGLNYLTVPFWGAGAAAITTVISYMMLAVLVWKALGRDRQDLPWRRLALEAVLIAPIVLGATIFYHRG